MDIRALAVAGVLAMTGASAHAASVTVSVNGSANPYLAGQPAGTSCCSGDLAPSQSPVLAPGALIDGSVLTFTVSSGFGYAGGTAADSGDGDHSGQTLTFPFTMPADYGTGIAGAANVNVDGLVGVFLTAATPGGPAPTPISYAPGGNSGGLAATSFAPGLAQIFWIGDGLTGTGVGTLQQFVVPTGATRLFLGSVDGGGWYNNSGLATVTISGLAEPTAGVPEPGAWSLLIAGLGATGAMLRRRRAQALAA